MSQLKLYGYLAACVVFAAAFGWYSWKVYDMGATEAEAELKTYKTQVERDRVKDERDRAKAKLEQEQRHAMELEALRAQIIIQTSKEEAALADLERDLADARVGLRIAVRQLPGFCKAGDPGGAEAVTARLARESEQAYLDHSRAIIQNKAWIAHAHGFMKSCGRE